MSVSWPEVVGVIGVSSASRMHQEGMTVVTDAEAESLEWLTKAVEVVLPVLETIAAKRVHSDEMVALAAGALRHLKVDGLPTPYDDLRLQLERVEEKNREARRVIRELLSITPTTGDGRTLSVYARANSYLKDMVP